MSFEGLLTLFPAVAVVVAIAGLAYVGYVIISGMFASYCDKHCPRA